MIKMLGKLFDKCKAVFADPGFMSAKDLQQQTGMSLSAISSLIEDKVNQAVAMRAGSREICSSKFIKPGGSNNLGFFIHELDGSEQKLLSKIACSKLLRQEENFLKWHQETYKSGLQGFAPNYTASGQLDAVSELDFVTIDFLKPVRTVAIDAIWGLFVRAESGHHFFTTSSFSDTSSTEGGSRIRNVLKHFVQEQDGNAAKTYVSTFFQERKAVLTDQVDRLNQIERVVLNQFESVLPLDSNLYGFVHGDFKKANMLFDQCDRLLLIDFQYVCYGLRLWDLAFFLSKEKKGFKGSVDFVFEKLESRQEKALLLICYVMAALLHPNEKNFEKTDLFKIKPALNLIKNLA